MQRVVWLRIAKLSLGSLWASSLMFLGLAWWGLSRSVEASWIATASLIPLSAGWFVVMMLIADELCPRALVGVTGFMKLTAALIFWGSAALTLGRVLL